MSHEESHPVVIVERSSGLGSFLWGALVGAGLGLLFAPRSGEETRQVLRSQGRRLRARAEETAEDLQSRVENGYERAKERVEAGFENARHHLGEKRAGAREAVEAGKAAVHSAREELERRLSDARSQRKRPRVADDEPAVVEAESGPDDEATA